MKKINDKMEINQITGKQRHVRKEKITIEIRDLERKESEWKKEKKTKLKKLKNWFQTLKVPSNNKHILFNKHPKWNNKYTKGPLL